MAASGKKIKMPFRCEMCGNMVAHRAYLYSVDQANRANEGSINCEGVLIYGGEWYRGMLKPLVRR